MRVGRALGTVVASALALSVAVALASEVGAQPSEVEAQRRAVSHFFETRASGEGRVVDVVGGGDVTADGLDDVIVAVAQSGFEYARVVAGGARRSSWVAFTDQLDGRLISGGESSDGRPVRACPVGVVGDVSGDGVDEVLLATCSDGRNGDVAALRVFVVYGSAGASDVLLGDLSEQPAAGFEVLVDRPRPGDVPRTVAALADVDGRGSPGFVVALGPADIDLDERDPPPMTVRVYRFDGAGGAELWAQYEGGSPSEALSGGDFDGDGRDEIVVVDVALDAPAVRVVRLPERAAAEPLPLRDLGADELFEFVLSQEEAVPSDGHGAGIGDFNGDGFDDVGVGQARQAGSDLASFDRIALGRPAGAPPVEVEVFGREDNQGVPMRPLGDLDGDGYDDVLVTLFDAAVTAVQVVNGRAGDADFSVNVGAGYFLHQPTPARTSGFGHRAAVGSGAGGAREVMVADRTRGSLYAYLVPPGPPLAGVAFDGDPGTAERVEPLSPLGGPVSSAVSWRASAGFGAKRVVIARQDVFADALSAAPLLDGGVLLLGPSSGPTEELIAEVERVMLEIGSIPEPPRVLLMGGEDALDRRYETTSFLARYGVRRVAGASRVETSVEVARLVGAGRRGAGGAGWGGAGVRHPGG